VIKEVAKDGSTLHFVSSCSFRTRELDLFFSCAANPLRHHAHAHIHKHKRAHSCFIVGLVYLQRIKDIDRDGKRTILTSYTIQRLLLTALMLASKFLDEPHCTNKQVVMSFPRRALSLVFSLRTLSAYQALSL
jgi:hypothetical protein